MVKDYCHDKHSKAAYGLDLCRTACGATKQRGKDSVSIGSE